MSVCLDSFALLAWLQNEVSASEVERFLERAENEEDFECYLSTINPGEVFYRLLRIKGDDEAEEFWEDAISGELPIVLVEPTQNRVREAARLKGQHPIALADEIGESPKTVSDIANELSYITPDIAMKLSDAFNTTPEY